MHFCCRSLVSSETSDCRRADSLRIWPWWGGLAYHALPPIPSTRLQKQRSRSRRRRNDSVPALMVYRQIAAASQERSAVVACD